MVLAISVVLVGVVGGIYTSRKRVVNDDAAAQIASSIQTVRNEAKQGLGPTNGATFTSGETLFGEGIEFRNNCGQNKPCLRVYKLKASPPDLSGNSLVSTYEQYDITLEQSFGFSLFPDETNCATAFVSCYAPPPAGAQQAPLSFAPLSLGSFASSLMIVTKTGSSEMYAFRKLNDELCEFNGTCGSLTSDQLIGPDAINSTNYTQNRSGVLRINTGQPNGLSQVRSSWDTTTVRYTITLNMSGTGQITVGQ